MRRHPESDRKSALIRYRLHVTRPMQDAHHNYLVRPRKIVDCIPLAERHTQVVCQLSARSAGERQLQQLVESSLEPTQEFRRDWLGSLVGQITPDLGQV